MFQRELDRKPIRWTEGEQNIACHRLRPIKHETTNITVFILRMKLIHFTDTWAVVADMTWGKLGDASVNESVRASELTWVFICSHNLGKPEVHITEHWNLTFGRKTLPSVNFDVFRALSVSGRDQLVGFVLHFEWLSFYLVTWDFH